MIDPLTVTVHKLDHTGRLVTSYQGKVIRREPGTLVLEARWQRGRLELSSGVILETGDRLIEFFFTDRWYSIFEIHAGTDDRLKGWYCNLSRPATLDGALCNGATLAAVDLALDVFVYPNRQILLLDEPEFEALGLQQSDLAAWRNVLAAVDELRAMAAQGRSPFGTTSVALSSPAI